ncbi:sigma-54 interaction domain-containing protein [Moorella sulfitireducens]|uniref:sigma-54 interaction domain-containing protein n=1 Tax=Neomoorella sulfitireducens TaxID=2972948 RepID=UPI0021AD33D7|nr:sigma 54-interacting transcriptional regulator [Moorella sulfitireducens]
MELEWLNLLMDNPDFAFIFVDYTGKIAFINRTYLNILGMRQEDVVGKNVIDILPETRTLTVIRTGKAIIGYNWTVNGYKMIVSSLPLVKNGKVLGCFAYGLFLDRWDERAKDMAENLIRELNMYKSEIRNLHSARYTFNDIIGNSRAIQNVKFLAQQVALRSTTTVLITGESGTGKELFAHAIHNWSSRSSMPFVRVNCAAIPENLLESELFGYAEGAFTGARKGGHPGKFELANGGTIFLDEIAEMSPTMQSKLLVVLQEKEFERLGSSHPIQINVRVIAATNRNLKEMVEQNRFRGDLYYRLNVFRLEIPPLRERLEDIPAIVKALIPKLNTCRRTTVVGVADETLELLQKYSWPGNVRELENVLESAIILADMEGARNIIPKHLAFMGSKLDYEYSPVGASLKKAVEEFEKRYIARVMQDCSFDKKKAAEILNMDLSWLYKKLKKYGIPTGK